MPQSQSGPVAILLVNEIAEEIKLTTLSFRGYFLFPSMMQSDSFPFKPTLSSTQH